MKLLVLANLGKPETIAALPRVAEAARALGIGLCAAPETARILECTANETDGTGYSRLSPFADAALVLGGDGSVLHAVAQLDGADMPVVAVNTGTLGYMACAGAERIAEVLRALRDGALVEEERRMLRADIPAAKDAAGTKRPPLHALNDIVVTRGDTGRILALDLAIDGTPVTSYLCDGLIVATPTGSTAYSLSAGGPILSPRTEAFVVSVICPHSLSSRPLVLPDSAALEIRVRRAATTPLVSADGQRDAPLVEGAVLRISRSERRVRLLRFPERDDFAVLRQKLGWNVVPAEVTGRRPKVERSRS